MNNNIGTSRKQLDKMKSVDITKVDRQSLVDITDIQIDSTLPTTQKMQSYLKHVKNPYCFLCGDTPVRIRFVSKSKTLAQSLDNYFSSLK